MVVRVSWFPPLARFQGHYRSWFDLRITNWCKLHAVNFDATMWKHQNNIEHFIQINRKPSIAFAEKSTVQFGCSRRISEYCISKQALTDIFFKKAIQLLTPFPNLQPRCGRQGCCSWLHRSCSSRRYSSCRGSRILPWNIGNSIQWSRSVLFSLLVYQ